MGQTAIKPRKQEPISVGTPVYFMGFTKNKKFGPVHYLCKAVVVESPSPFNKAPHKVKIEAVALSKLHKGGSEEDGRTLLSKEVHLQLDKLTTELQSFMTPTEWWS